MFLFVVRYLNFLKAVPLLPLIFEGMLRLHLLVFKPSILTVIDEIEVEVRSWEGISVTTHKYGGLQFNYKHKEVGHVHGNGMLDVLLNKKTMQELLHYKRVVEHHSIRSSGWVSFNIRSSNDKVTALRLLAKGYELRKEKIHGFTKL